MTTNRPVSGRPFIHARPAKTAELAPEPKPELGVENTADLDFDMLGGEDEDMDMGQHLVKPEASESTLSNPAAFNDTPQETSHISCSSAQQNAFTQAQTALVLSDFQASHPSAHLNRKETSEIERQNINIKAEYGGQIDLYMRQLERQYLTNDSLAQHKITPALRARMVDWMIEVLTNFKCEDQTFFLAVSLLDRFLKATNGPQEIADLHLLGVTSMFIASKYEDVYPLKMKVVFEKIAHKRLPMEKIKAVELDYLKTLHYKIVAPSILDFLKIYLKEVLFIGHAGNTSLRKEEKEALPTSSDCPEGQRTLMQKMAVYLSKMSMHDYDLAGRRPSLVAVGCLYVALKICE